MSVRARVIEQDGEVVAVAGYYRAGAVMAMFSDVKVQLPKMTIWREAKAMMEGFNLPAYCLAANSSAAKFLQRLGWTHYATTDEGEFYVWLP